MSSNRQLLLVTPAFFGYERDIVAELERQGHRVTLIDERPTNSAMIRAAIRVRKSMLSRRIDRYYRKHLLDIETVPFDMVIVIKGEVVPRWFLEAVRLRNPEAEFVFYTYDSLSNAPNCLTVMDLFDRRLSFDRADVSGRPDFDYLPLFYTPEFSENPSPTPRSPKRYSLAFIGTLHSDRHAIAKRLGEAQSNPFMFFFVQARWYFFILKYVSRRYSRVSWREVSFSPMSRAEIAAIFQNAHAVLDIQRDGQTGLTMRTFEVLASGAILVTTNRAVSEEPFYDPERILVIDGALETLTPHSVARRLLELPSPYGAPAGFHRYSLASWGERLVGTES